MPNQAKGYCRKKSSPPRHQLAALRVRAVGAHHEVAFEPLGGALVGEADGRPVALDAVDGDVGHPEPQVAAVGEALRDEVDSTSCCG